MIHDFIVDEVREFRDEIAKEYAYDIDAIFAALCEMGGNQWKRVHVSRHHRYPQ